MITSSVVRQPAPPAPPAGPAPSATQQLMIFAITAVGLGGALLTLSTLVQPGAPFLIAAVLLVLALPALVLTHREGGGAGVRALLRDCARLPGRWWWLPLAAFGLPIATWAAGTALGGARPITWGLVAFYAVDLVIGAVVINIWEEMAWTGFFQRRAVSRWGLVGGSLVTAAFFLGIHIPLAVGGARTPGEAATNLAYLAGTAIGFRLLIARVDAWSGRSLLVVGILHSAFNASEAVLEPEFAWVRVAVTIALGVGVVVFSVHLRGSRTDRAIERTTRTLPRRGRSVDRWRLIGCPAGRLRRLLGGRPPARSLARRPCTLRGAGQGDVSRQPAHPGGRAPLAQGRRGRR